MSDTRLKAPVSTSGWSIHDGPPRPARNAARSPPRRSLRGSTAATADAFSIAMSPRLVSRCIWPHCGREPAFRRKACGMPRSLPEKPSALAHGAFTDLITEDPRLWGGRADLQIQAAAVTVEPALLHPANREQASVSGHGRSAFLPISGFGEVPRRHEE